MMKKKLIILKPIIILIVLKPKGGKQVRRIVKADTMKKLLGLLVILFISNTRYIGQWIGGELIDFRLISGKKYVEHESVQQKSEKQFADGCARVNLTHNETVSITMLWKYIDRVDIAEFLGCTVGTVNTHISNVYIKLSLLEKSPYLAINAILA